MLSLNQQASRIAGSGSRPAPTRPPTPSVYIAQALIVRALRHAGLHQVMYREACTVGVAGVRPGSYDAVSAAMRRIMGSEIGGSFGFDVCVYDRTDDAPRSRTGLRSLVRDAAKANERAAFLFSSREAVPAAFIASAEGVVDLDSVDHRLLRGAFMALVGRAPDTAGLDMVAALPLDLLDSVLVRGRSLKRSVAVARRLLAVVEDETGTDAEPAAIAEPTLTKGPRLEDLSGLGEVAAWGFELARDLGDYRRGTIPWSDVDRGVLVAGPPGVGKTLFAQALARTCGVPLHVHSCATWQARGHLGDLLKAMGKAFDEARKDAPCILFLDEADAFGSRTDPGDRYSAYSRQVIDGLLEKLDGAVGRDGVVVVGATNRPELIDEAILRPGRLERVLHLGLPDAGARIGILRHHLGDALETLDLRPFAERLEGRTGAEIEILVRDARRKARRRREPMSAVDLGTLLPPAHRMSHPLLRRVCVHEAAHLVVGTLLADEAGSDPVEATVDRSVSESAAGGTMFVRRPGFDRTLGSLRAEIAVLLSGTVAEEEILGNRGDGAGGSATSDLARATAIAVAIEASYGFGEGLAHMVSERAEVAPLLVGDAALRARVEATLAGCRERARDVVRAERGSVERLAAVLAREGRAAFAPSPPQAATHGHRTASGESFHAACEIPESAGRQGID